MSKEYWWCKNCNKNVDILHAPDVGIFCIKCGKKVTKPHNIEDPIFYDFGDEEIFNDSFIPEVNANEDT